MLVALLLTLLDTKALPVLAVTATTFAGNVADELIEILATEAEVTSAALAPSIRGNCPP